MRSGELSASRVASSGVPTKSRLPTPGGSLYIQSSSIFDPPTINPNYLAVEGDLDIYVEAVKAGQPFLTAPAWKGYLGTSFLQGAADLTSDANVKDYIRNRAISLRHPVSTAKISKNSDKGSIAGPDLLVKGANSLRIVDASVLPFAPAAHPQGFTDSMVISSLRLIRLLTEHHILQAAVYIIAERAADLIKAAHGLL